MDPNDELRAVQEASMTGWSSERARATISRSLNILEMTTQHVEAHIHEWLETRRETADQAVTDFVESVDKVRRIWDQAGSTRQEHRTEYRILQDATAAGVRLHKVVHEAPLDIIKMSADVVKILKSMIDTTERVNKMMAQLEAALDHSEGPIPYSNLSADKLTRILAIVAEEE